MRLGAPHKQRLPLPRELSNALRLTEGEITKFRYNLRLSFRHAYGVPPSSQRKAWFCKHFNLISPVGTALAAVRQYDLYIISCGQGRALSLRYDMKYNLIVSVNSQYSLSAGASPALRYTIYSSSCAVRFYYTNFTSSLFTITSYLACKGAATAVSAHKKRLATARR